MLLADRRTGAVGAAHAGWRGSAQGVARVAVAAMREHFNSSPRDLVVALGPSIGPCCYEVGEDVRRAFLESDGHRGAVASWFASHDGLKPRLDLWRANRDQLVQAGVPPAQVHRAGLCTATRRDLFFSYRARAPPRAAWWRQSRRPPSRPAVRRSGPNASWRPSRRKPGPSQRTRHP
jgi:hypothetical protein